MQTSEQPISFETDNPTTMKKHVIAICLVFLSYFSFSQDTKKNEDDNSSGRYSSFQINFSTIPTQSISGTDTSYSNSFSIAPVLDLRSKSGWGLSYSPAIITSAAKTGIYLHTLSAGFERYGKGNADLAFSYNHFIATNKTSVPYTPISNEIFFYTGYTGTWVHPLLSASYGFGKDSSATAGKIATEFALQAGVNHSFDWDQTGPFSSIEFTPGLILNAGNNQYFSFLSASKYMAHSKQMLKQVKKSEKNKKTADSSAPFQLSNLELNTEIQLEVGRFSLQPDGSIFVPVGSTDHTIFGYWQVGLHYSF